MGATSGPGAVVSNVNASPPSGIGRHSPAKQNQSLPAFVNFHFCFGDLVPGELEEMRRRDQTPANWKAPPFRTEIDDRRSFRSSRWEAPSQLGKLVRPVFETPDYRGLVGRPDVLARLQVRRSLRPSHGDACLAEGS